jgi:cytochrome c peroxidase
MLAVLLGTACAGASAASLAGDLGKPLNAEERQLMTGVLLGKRLFEDTRLSEPAGLLCASCHYPVRAFRGDNHSPVTGIARGSLAKSIGTRKVPSLLYASYSPLFAFLPRRNDVTGRMEIVPVGGQFWDGRAAEQQEQATGPLLNPVEMNNPSRQAVVDKVRAGGYAELVRDVFGADAFNDADIFDKLASAIASYEASPRFKPFSSKFDDWLEGRVLLSKKEWRGYQIFIDPKKGNCLSCHDGGGADEAEGGTPAAQGVLSRNPKNWLFTDFTYDTLGAPRNARIPANADPAHFDLGLCERHDLRSLAPEGYDLGRLCGAFKVPSLRNVAVNGPYLHNGIFTRLRDAVAFYFTRDTDPGRWFPKAADGHIEKFNDLPEGARANVNVVQAPYDRKRGEKPRATDAEIDALVAFLETLTDKAYLPAKAERGR